jgi:hypothetical protein
VEGNSKISAADGINGRDRWIQCLVREACSCATLQTVHKQDRRITTDFLQGDYLGCLSCGREPTHRKQCEKKDSD